MWVASMQLFQCWEHAGWMRCQTLPNTIAVLLLNHLGMLPREVRTLAVLADRHFAWAPRAVSVEKGSGSPGSPDKHPACSWFLVKPAKYPCHKGHGQCSAWILASHMGAIWQAIRVSLLDKDKCFRKSLQQGNCLLWLKVQPSPWLQFSSWTIMLLVHQQFWTFPQRGKLSLREATNGSALIWATTWLHISSSDLQRVVAIAVPDTTGGQKSKEGPSGLMSPLCSWIKFQRKVTTHATKVIQLFYSILWFANQSHKSKVLRRKLCHCPVPMSTSPVFSFCCLLTDCRPG